jgi:hypothetical protein
VCNACGIRFLRTGSFDKAVVSFPCSSSSISSLAAAIQQQVQQQMQQHALGTSHSTAYLLSCSNSNSSNETCNACTCTRNPAWAAHLQVAAFHESGTSLFCQCHSMHLPASLMR